MSQIKLTIRHGQTLEVARERLGQAVAEVHNRFGTLVQRIDWTPDRSGVELSGTGFQVNLRVDPQDVHVTGDVPLLGNLLGSTVLTGLKNLLQQTFQKGLPDRR